VQVVHPFRAVRVRDPTRTPAGERRPVDVPIIGGQIDVLAIWSDHVIVVDRSANGRPKSNWGLDDHVGHT
jgi:hypothetical protein